jgi:hypothetical protein
MASSTSSDEDDSSWADADFSGLDDLGALQCFVGIYDNLLDNGDSDNGAHVAITLEGGSCARCRPGMKTARIFSDRIRDRIRLEGF